MPLTCWGHVWVAGGFRGIGYGADERKIALPMSMLALHACTHDSHYGVGKEFPQHSTQKPLTISGGAGMEHVGILWGTGGEPVGILWGTGGEPGLFFGEPGFGGCLAP